MLLDSVSLISSALMNTFKLQISLPWLMVSPPSPLHRVVSWAPPPCDHVKVNFDASWSNGRPGLGFSIRYHFGIVLHAAAIKTPAYSLPESELLAAWNALTSAT